MGSLCTRRRSSRDDGMPSSSPYSRDAQQVEFNNRLPEYWELCEEDFEHIDEEPDELRRLRRRVRLEDVNRWGRYKIYRGQV